ncbi:MAG: carbon starvation protein [Phycisphaerales bacterium]|jgi:carbon starvation protein
MGTALIALGSLVLYILAYRTYGRHLAARVFRLDPERVSPAVEINDGVDFVPSRRGLVFGHHFTSIAGTGPIVGPAVAVIWGWVPALVWVLVGSIFVGAVHDFGSLVVSMRHRGRTIGDLAGDVVNRRVRLLFLLVVVIALWIVLAIFGLVIAAVFARFPASIAPVWMQIPIAVGLGVWLRRGGSLLVGTVVAVGLMYATIAWSAGVDWANVWSAGQGPLPVWITASISPIAFWTLILGVYVFIASVLPVQTLLQPRDYINSYQLLVAMGLLSVGLIVSHPPIVADAVQFAPAPATEGGLVPAFLPFLFVTIACGACSGFHCLISSGCSSRQLTSECDAKFVGYGAMLTEGFLAVLVILACVAGLGLGTSWTDGAAALTGRDAFMHHYATWGGGKGLGDKLEPFIVGAANAITTIGISRELAVAIMGVFVASFAATTLDSSTRLQRYVIAELAGGAPETGAATGRVRVGWLTNRYAATTLAVLTGLGLALSDAFSNGLVGAGTGGLILWPIFGATNQLLAGLALLVITVWLMRQGRSVWVTAVPMVFMLAMTGWAITLLLLGFAQADGWRNGLLLSISVVMLLLEGWIVLEAVSVARSVLRERATSGS